MPPLTVFLARNPADRGPNESMYTLTTPTKPELIMLPNRYHQWEPAFFLLSAHVAQSYFTMTALDPGAPPRPVRITIEEI